MLKRAARMRRGRLSRTTQRVARAAFSEAVARGLPPAAAARQVGVSVRTAQRWRIARDSTPGSRSATTRFFGRESELTALARDLTAGHRLLTIVGPGGIGKSRLAVELERHLGPGEGAIDLDLSAAGTAEQIAADLCQALGDTGKSGWSVDQAALAIQRSGRRLLVLDGCERVVASLAGLIAAWLTACPRLAIVATSRVELGLSGEQLHRLGGLACDLEGPPPSSWIAPR
jgi:hypothetical protein